MNDKGFKANTSQPAIICSKLTINTRTRCEMCSKVTIKTPERRLWRRSGVFIVNFEHVIAEKFSGIFKGMKLDIKQKWVETIEHTQLMVYITYCCSCYSIKSS